MDKKRTNQKIIKLKRKVRRLSELASHFGVIISRHFGYKKGRKEEFNAKMKQIMLINASKDLKLDQKTDLIELILKTDGLKE